MITGHLIIFMFHGFCGWVIHVTQVGVLIKTISLLLFIIIVLGKYFPTSEVGVDPKTIKDHDVVPQGNYY